MATLYRELLFRYKCKLQQERSLRIYVTALGERFSKGHTACVILAALLVCWERSRMMMLWRKCLCICEWPQPILGQSHKFPTTQQLKGILLYDPGSGKDGSWASEILNTHPYNPQIPHLELAHTYLYAHTREGTHTSL